MQSLVEFGLAVLEKNFLVNFANACILANISFLSPFGKGHGPLCEKNLNPFTKRCCVPVLIDNCPVVLEMKDENMKNLQTDGRRII